MIVNFYKMRYHNTIRDAELLTSKNISCIPRKETHIKFSGQRFIIDSVYFDINSCEYNIYMIRVWNK